MNTDDRGRLNALSARVIGAAQTVSTTLGCGFLEKVYENALAVELRRLDLPVAQQSEIIVRYRDEVVGQYLADLVVGGQLIVELKAVRDLDSAPTAQCINYLRASGLPLCLLINFSRPRLAVPRVINP